MKCCYHCGDEVGENADLDVHCNDGQGLTHCNLCVIPCDLCEEIYCGMTGPSLTDYNGLLLCETCLEIEKANTKTLMEKLIAAIEIPGYWYTGQVQNDDETILEYISSDNPKIRVRIARKER